MQNKVIKCIVVLLVAFSCLVLLTGCTNKETADENELKKLMHNHGYVDQDSI